MMERTVCISVTCCSSERTPRTLVDITDPIARIETATIASAISTSMIVKPAVRPSVGEVARNNFNPSGQPVDTNLIADIRARQGDGSAARHSAGKEANRRQRFALVAGTRQKRLEGDVIRHTEHGRRRAGSDNAASGIDQSARPRPAPRRRGAILL